MKPNPGGVITGDEIVNREQEINLIWRALEVQSVVLISERRVGKTCVLRKIEENPKNDWNPIPYWVEGNWHPIEFVEGLYGAVISKGMIENKFYKLKSFYKKYVNVDQIGNWKIPQIKENWKILLESLIQDIIAANNKVLLMLDELPIMISNFIKSGKNGPQIAMEFLDTMRELRQKYEATKKISFIFSGSIGIHLVIKELKRNYGYTADPINNMRIITLTGMIDSGAKELCEKLSEDGNFQFENNENIIDYICKNTDNLPFYIQHVFEYFYENNKREITVAIVDESINYLFNDPKDEGFFRHYTDRIKTYYDKDMVEIALFILNKACKKTYYWEEGDIINTVNSHKEIDNETIKETLDLLWSDHYLTRKIENNKRLYTFTYTILKKWWEVNRG